MATLIDPLPDFIMIPLGKGCVLVLSETEYLRGIARGKTLRRRQAEAQREAARRAEDAPREGDLPTG